MRFQDYLVLEKEAKWALTFGEGLDGYFGGVFIRGGIGFAVYNEDFFTPDYKELRTVYPSYEVMITRLVDDIQRLDNKQDLQTYSSDVRSKINAVWAPINTRNALEAFYRGHY